MKRKDLINGDILVVDYRDIGRPVVYYVVMGNVAVSFKGDVNCGKKPSGWYDEMDKDIDLPYHTIAVYRAKWVADTFNGDFDNKEIYECLWRKGDEQ